MYSIDVSILRPDNKAIVTMYGEIHTCCSCAGGWIAINDSTLPSVFYTVIYMVRIGLGLV